MYFIYSLALSSFQRYWRLLVLQCGKPVIEGGFLPSVLAIVDILIAVYIVSIFFNQL